MTDQSLDPPAHWEFYPCQMEEGRAWFAIDLGVAETLRESFSSTLLALQITLGEHRDGIATPAELEVLEHLVESIEAYAREHRGRYVGHYTCAGARYAFVYADIDEATANELVTAAARAAQREVRYYLDHEPNFDAYFELLSPTDDDWRVINDLRVFDLLRENGDPLTEPRRIDHVAFFDDRDAAQDFADWLSERGYALEGVDADSEDGAESFRVRFWQVELPTIWKLDTVALRHACDERGGEYDGWECPVLGGEANGDGVSVR